MYLTMEKAKVVLMALILLAMVWLTCWVIVLCTELRHANQQVESIRSEVQEQNRLMRDFAKQVGLGIQ